MKAELDPIMFEFLVEISDVGDDRDMNDLLRAFEMLAETIEAPDKKILTQWNEGDIPVIWYKTEKSHIIAYGLQVIEHDSELKAARMFGDCVRHSLFQAGKLIFSPPLEEYQCNFETFSHLRNKIDQNRRMLGGL